jgi:glycosyltransferase involved in cell wall biosynthesis
LAQYDLSVLLVTYNHAPFVAEAVRSVLAQRIGTPFEIVVADDASEDGTRDIIVHELRDATSIPVRFLDHSRNRGMMRNYQRAFEACNSRYVAVLEGDDYWLSPDKLARQMAVLDTYRDCPLCGTNFHFFDAASGSTFPRVPASDTISFLGPADLIAENMPGNFSACIYRIEALRSLPPRLFDVLAADWIVNICAARSGPLAFLHEPMSFYRLHAGSFWSSLPAEERHRERLKLIPIYDEITDRAFHADFEKLRVELQTLLGDVG